MGKNTMNELTMLMSIIKTTDKRDQANKLANARTLRKAQANAEKDRQRNMGGVTYRTMEF